MNENALIAIGGTGGHVFPIMANHLVERTIP